jgi:hypothetical protein
MYSFLIDDLVNAAHTWWLHIGCAAILPISIPHTVRGIHQVIFNPVMMISQII